MVMSYEVQVIMTETPLNKKTEAIISRGMDLTQIELQRNVKINSPVDEGKLQGSWFRAGAWRKASNNSRSIKSSAKYAALVNDGHLTRPSKSPMARNMVSHAGKSYTNPTGQRWVPGQHYIEKSIAQTESRVPEFFIRATMEQGA